MTLQGVSEWQKTRSGETTVTPVSAPEGLVPVSQWKSTRPVPTTPVSTPSTYVAPHLVMGHLEGTDVNKADTLGGIVRNTISGLPQASGIPDALHSSFKQATDAVNEINTAQPTYGKAITQGAESALKLGAGVAAVVFAPLAPFTNLIGKAIELAGYKLATAPRLNPDVPTVLEKYGNANVDTTTDPAIRTFTALQNLGGIAMGILGAKAGDVKTGTLSSEALNELSKNPAIAEAVRNVVDTHAEAQKTTEITKPMSVSEWQSAGKPTQPSIAPKTTPTIAEVPKPAEIAPTVNEVPKPTIPPELQPLAQEAQKYKSAEEFVKAVTQDRGGIGAGVEYSPAKRLVQTGINDTPITDFGFKPTDKITIYRGVDRASQTKIQAGDYVALSEDLAKSYTGGKVLSEQVPASSVRVSSGDGLTTKDFKDTNNMHIEAVYNPTTPIPASQLTDFYNKVKEETQPIEPIAGAPKPVESTNTEFASRVYERMKAENPDVLTENVTATRTNLKEDAQKAVDLISKDKQKAFNVAMGAETSPEVTSTAVNIAMTEKAISDGNYDLAGKLIKNRSLEQTRRGQEIVAERGSITDNSTSRYVKELIASRLDALGKNYFDGLKIKRVADKTKAIKKVDSEVAKVQKQISSKKLDTKTALSLLDKLACV